MVLLEGRSNFIWNRDADRREGRINIAVEVGWVTRPTEPTARSTHRPNRPIDRPNRPTEPIDRSTDRWADRTEPIDRMTDPEPTEPTDGPNRPTAPTERLDDLTRPRPMAWLNFIHI